MDTGIRGLICLRRQSVRRHHVWNVLQRVFRVQFLGRPTIVKQRFSKKYRHPALDAKLTSLRLKQAGASSRSISAATLPTN